MGAKKVKDAVPVLSTHMCLKRLPGRSERSGRGNMPFTAWSTPQHSPAQQGLVATKDAHCAKSLLRNMTVMGLPVKQQTLSISKVASRTIPACSPLHLYRARRNYACRHHTLPRVPQRPVLGEKRLQCVRQCMKGTNAAKLQQPLALDRLGLANV